MTGHELMRKLIEAGALGKEVELAMSGYAEGEGPIDWQRAVEEVELVEESGRTIVVIHAIEPDGL